MLEKTFNDYEKPLVTALIVTHNRLDLVKEAIQSVHLQTYPNIELIVVDDASDDNIREELTTISQREGFQYVYINKEDSKGGNHARNIGIKQAKGKYVAFLDDDDEWLPKKIEKQVEVLESNDDYKVCHCGRIKDYNYGKYQEEIDASTLAEGDLHIGILLRNRCVTSAMIIDRELLIDVGMFDETLQYWQEYELCIRLLQKTKLAVVRESLLLYRIIYSDEQRLTNKIDGWELTVQRIYQKHSDKMAMLSKKQLKQRDAFHYHDGAMRCHNSGDYSRQREYLWKTFQMTHSPEDLIKAMFNIYSFKEFLGGVSYRELNYQLKLAFAHSNNFTTIFNNCWQFSEIG